MNEMDESLSRHRRAWELIPWLVNGRATAEERRVVEEHLADCQDCREEFEFQSRLGRAMSAETDAVLPADHVPALDRLWQRIDASAVSAPLPRRSGALARTLLAAVLIEAIGIAALSAALFTRDTGRDPANPYRTLSAPAEAAPRASIRAVLAPELSLGELQALLGRSRLQIVGGPSEAGVYTLAPLSARAEDDPQAALAVLRSHPGVRFAEPVDSAPRAP